jgi:ubiquinone/menaquinone biosynthesis C-methylase UbiE
MKKENAQERAYNKFYEKEKINFTKLDLKKWPKNRYEAAVRFLDLKKDKKVLDVGCGGGVILNYLKGKCSLYGVDISSKRIELLKNIFGKEVILEKADLNKKTLFEDNFFDIIIMSDVIEHIVDRNHTLKEIKRILKKGGTLAIITPNQLKIKNRIKMLLGKYPSTALENEGYGNKEEILYDGGHLQYFTFRTLEILMKKYDFKIIKKFGFGRFGKIHNFFPELFSGGIGMLVKK